MPPFMLDATIKGSLILLLAGGLIALMRRRSAAARHLVLCVALFSAAAVPVAAWLLPSLTLRLPAAQLDNRTEGLAAGADGQMDRRTDGQAASVNSELPSDRPTVSPFRPSVSPPVRSARPSVRLADLAPYFVYGWMIVAGLLLTRLLAGLFRLSRLARYAFPVNHPAAITQLYGAVRALGLTRPVRLLRSDEVSVPVTWGLRTATVVLPADCEEWDDERVRAVLIHELAHAARFDFATQLGAELCCAVYWFNPLTWVAVRAIRAERERACDDRVLTSGTRASAYAAELLALAQAALLPEPPRVALAMARRSELEGRLLAILNPAVRRGSPRGRAALSIAALALAITLPLSALQVDRTPKPPAPPQQPTPPAPRPPLAQQPPRAPAPRTSVPMVPAAPGRDTPVPSLTPMMAVPGVRESPVPSLTEMMIAPAAPAAPHAPAAPQVACDRSKTKSSHVSTLSNNGRKTWKVTWEADDCSVDLRAQGEVRFNADFTDVSDISSGGYFELTVRENGATRRLELRPQGSGLRRNYLVDGNAAPWDEAARTWFADFLITLDRQTGFGIETRFPALMRQGTNAVFSEIDRVGSDYVRGLWYRKLFGATTLSAADVRRAARGAGTTMESDYELGRVLAALASRYSLADTEVRDAFIDAAGTLESDYERAQLLLVVASQAPVTPEAGRAIVKLAGSMDSDYEKARVLMALGKSSQMDPRTAAPEYLDVVVGMESDYERGRVLKLILESGQLSRESLLRVLGVVGRMESDYEAANVLIALTVRNTLDDTVRAAYLKAADNLRSDYESNRARAALTRRT